MEFEKKNPEDIKAKKFLDLVMKENMAPSKAAKECNVSLSQIRTKDGIWAEVRDLLERSEGLLDPAIRKKIARARALELALQDEDLKVTLGATKLLHDELGLVQKSSPQVGIQINVLKDEPQVKAALDTIDISGEIVFDEEKKSFSLSTGPASEESTDPVDVQPEVRGSAD